MAKRTRIFLLFVGALLFTGLLYLFFSSQSRFLNYCDNFFIEEMEGNALTLHFTVADEKNYGIDCKYDSLGTYDTDPASQKRRLYEKYAVLKTICKSRLSDEMQRLYDNLEYSLHTEIEGLKFSLLEEPLVPSIGIQSQLPILLAEYSFENEEDVNHYLNLLADIPNYFDAIISLEEEKIERGLFMDEISAKELITYCEEFCQTQNNHFLEATFEERILPLNLDTRKNQAYIQKNTSILKSCVFPAYENLCSFLKKNQSQGQNADGLYYFPKGTDYYAWLLHSEIGVNYSFEQIETLLDNALKTDARIIASLTEKNPSILSDRQHIAFDTSNPAALTSYLAKRVSSDFPEIPEVHLELCDVPKSMEPHLSPAFYLVPPIDRWNEHIIYLNHGYLKEGISFFTTLAHESFPGHLYQNVYENHSNPHPIQRLLYCGGYTEGWATYAEQLSYYYAPISTDMAALLSTTRSMTLNLYSHLDLYIHAYGWTEEDCASYLKKFGITNAASVHDMFILVKQQPANYLKYYLGYLEICRFKERARNCLGSKFDLKTFHEFILSYGPAPFPLLETYFEQWLKTYEKGFSDLENPRLLSKKTKLQQTISQVPAGTAAYSMFYNF